jgi:hypothetical protein
VKGGEIMRLKKVYVKEKGPSDWIYYDEDGQKLDRIPYGPHDITELELGALAEISPTLAKELPGLEAVSGVESVLDEPGIKLYTYLLEGSETKEDVMKKEARKKVEEKSVTETKAKAKKKAVGDEDAKIKTKKEAKREKAVFPEELYKHPRIGELLKKYNEHRIKDYGLRLNKMGFKMRDPETWKPFLADLKKVEKKEAEPKAKAKKK